MDSLPKDVIDVILPEGNSVNLARLYVHFTGNAAGGSRNVCFGGVNATVIAGASVAELAYKKTTPQTIYWASLHESELIETRYIVHLLVTGGSRAVDILSVIFAKPEQKMGKENNRKKS